MGSPQPWKHIHEAAPADWAVISAAQALRHEREYRWCLRLLRACRAIRDGFPVDQLAHALQVAARAERAGVDEELVLAALLHDLAKPLGLDNHDRIGAEILRDRVSERTY